MTQGFYTTKTDFLDISGADKQDFFNRISSNSFVNFPEFTYIRTVFLDEKGRIVDFCTVINTGQNYKVLCTKGNGIILTEHLIKYTVTEDINVTLNECTLTYAAGIDSLITSFDFSGNRVFFQDGTAVLYDDYGFSKYVIVQQDSGEITFPNNTLHDLPVIPENEFDVLSKKKFFLYSKDELNSGNNPLECGLEKFVSFTKGCYIGQEVVARMESQGKIPKRLVYIQCQSEFTKGDLIISEDNEECGNITSVAEKNGYHGLGFIKSNYLGGADKFFLNKREIFINYKNK